MCHNISIWVRNSDEKPRNNNNKISITFCWFGGFWCYCWLKIHQTYTWKTLIVRVLGKFAFFKHQRVSPHRTEPSWFSIDSEILFGTGFILRIRQARLDSLPECSASVGAMPLTNSNRYIVSVQWWISVAITLYTTKMVPSFCANRQNTPKHLTRRL